MSRQDGPSSRLSEISSGSGDEIAGQFTAGGMAQAAAAQRKASIFTFAVTGVAAVLLALAVVSSWAFSSRLPLGENAAPGVRSQSADATSEPADPTQDAKPNASADMGLSEVEAVIAARAAAPDSATQPVVAANAGPANEQLKPLSSYETSSHVEPDHWIWVVVTDSGGDLNGVGTIVVLDFFTGEVYEVIRTRG